MNKQLCLIDFVIWEENSLDPYVTWDELKEVMTYGMYGDLIMFLIGKKIHQRREGISTWLLKEFLSKQS